MNRRSIFALSAITVVGLALVPGSSVAQQGSLKQQLVGIWTALSAESTGPNGAKQQFYGAPLMVVRNSNPSTVFRWRQHPRNSRWR